jgi:hypothetical protein
MGIVNHACINHIGMVGQSPGNQPLVAGEAIQHPGELVPIVGMADAEQANTGLPLSVCHGPA